MSQYQILPCRLGHLRELSRTMRAEDRAEFEAAGMVPRHRLHQLYRMTPRPLAAMIDGEVACAWGDAGTILGDEGLMWMVTAPVIERMPLAYFREARRDIAERLKVRRSLRSCIVCPYDRAVRFFSLLGFAVSEPEFYRGHEYRHIRIERG